MQLRINKTVYLICSLLISTQTFSIFDLSPWIVIDNTTQLDFTCKITAVYYPDKDENLTVFINNDSKFEISFEQAEDEDENECIKITMTCMCKAKHANVINPMFYEQELIFNPQITSITFTNESLQVTTYCDKPEPDSRYFSLKFCQDNGLTLKAYPITTYIKCLSNIKQSIRSVILLALQAADYLPY